MKGGQGFPQKRGQEVGVASGREYLEVRICSQDGRCLYVREQEKIIDRKE